MRDVVPPATRLPWVRRVSCVGRVGVEAEKELRQKGAEGVKLHSHNCGVAF
jgi:alkylated DNA nucleotide flippase Atl1